MGCGSSSSTMVVRPLGPEKFTGEEDETGSKHSARGDSAVSKTTTDSGVVMESREIPPLPGTVPPKLLPLTPSGASPPLLRRDSQTQDRQKSSEILEELLNQGIIPMNPSHENSTGAGEAYSIMLNKGEEALRRPPARLESLKTNKTHLSKEEIDEKIRLADERRKQKEEDMKSRLRAKSARVRVPTCSLSTGEEEDLVEELSAPAHVPHSPAEGAEGEAETRGGDVGQPQDRPERGESDMVPVPQEGELSDTGSDISFTPATVNDEVY